MYFGLNKSIPDQGSLLTTEFSIIDQLEAARCNIESRFIAAGRLLEGAVEVVSKQIESLDHLTGAINDQSVDDTTAHLLGAAARLTELPASQAVRHERVAELSELSGALRRHIDEMRVTLKYLRVFAINMKITAAGSALSAASFNGFTEEVFDRIDEGVGELGLIDRQLADLQNQLDSALDIGRDLQAQCGRWLPAVPDSLAADAAAIAAFIWTAAATRPTPIPVSAETPSAIGRATPSSSRPTGCARARSTAAAYRSATS